MKKKSIISIVVLLLLILMVFIFPIKKKIYYSNGIVQEDYFVNGLFSNVKNGTNSLYEMDGRLTHKLEYKKGKLNGISEYFHKNGKLKAKVEYIDDKLMNIIEYYDNCGRKLDFGSLFNGNGFLKIYYENGIIEEEGNIKNGLRDGVWSHYLNPDNKSIKVDNSYINGVDHDGFQTNIFF